jgi:NAD(P)-dependent dehydrogenase (short-subunit alcohol dehydrogenase family)
MRALRGGSIINLGSISWMITQRGTPVYTTSKSAIQRLTRSLARDLGPHGIRVNTLVPGWVMTEKQLRMWVTPRRAVGRSTRTNACPPASSRPTSRAWPCSSLRPRPRAHAILPLRLANWRLCGRMHSIATGPAPCRREDREAIARRRTHQTMGLANAVPIAATKCAVVAPCAK